MRSYDPDDEVKTYAAGALVIAVFGTLALWGLWHFVMGLTVPRRLELAGAASGLLGAMMLAAKTKRMAWGWVAFTASNIVLLCFYWIQGHTYLLVMQLGYLVTSMVGIYTWLITPALNRLWGTTDAH